MKKNLSKSDKQKAKQNFEKDPPLCINCRSVSKIFIETKGNRQPKHYCNFGKFTTQLFSVCDRWMSKKGETIRED